MSRYLSKKMIRDRLEFFKKSSFIQSFPVVILACGPYIRNRKERQIDNTFGVTFRDGQPFSGTGIRFYNHYNENNTKLVIHTRQLSNFHGDGDDLIERMSRNNGATGRNVF